MPIISTPDADEIGAQLAVIEALSQRRNGEEFVEGVGEGTLCKVVEGLVPGLKTMDVRYGFFIFLINCFV